MHMPQISFSATIHISTNSWEWPNARGDIPSPRFTPSVVISEDILFLFGGFVPNIGCNDLFILDMACMRWKKVHGNLSNSEVPSKNMRRPTLTCFSQSTALLLGRTTHHHASNQVNNTWLLNLHNAKNLMDPSSIWTNVPNHSSRCCHATVLQPLSKILWVIGGHDGTMDCPYPEGHTTEVLKIKLVKLRPLKELAIEHLGRNLCANDPRLVHDQLPKELMNQIETYKSENGEE